MSARGALIAPRRKETAGLVVTAARRAWLVLFSRILLFAGLQAVLALGFRLAGNPAPWDASAAWWLLTVAAADLACLALLVRAFRLDGARFRDLFRIERSQVKGDLLALLFLTLLAAPLSYLPNVLLGGALFGSPEATLPLLVRPLPFWAVYAAMVLFPLAQGATELAAYFGFVMPRFEAAGMKPWMAVSLPALVLGLQHIAAPLLFDLRFIAWRGLMFLPFAVMIGIGLHWRPRVLPYLAVVHVLMNLSFAMMFLEAAY